jgi:HSP20 family protein
MKVPVRSHVLRELSGLQDRLKQLLHKVVGGKRREDLVSYGSFRPLTNIRDKSEKLVFEIEVPGLDRKDLDVTLDGNVLSVRGERKFARDEKEGNWLWKESFHGAFATSFTLPEWVDSESIQANCRNGVLRIEIGKKSWALPKRIPIRNGSQNTLSQAA